METIKRVTIILICAFLNSCTDEKTEVFQLRWADYRYGNVYHYYVISNPPRDKLELIKLVDEYTLNVKFKDSIKIKNAVNFAQTFYEEGWTVNRHSGPNHTGRGISRVFGKKYYRDVELIHVVRSGGLSNVIHDSINIVNQNSQVANTPYYSIKDGGSYFNFYPNGLKNNPNKRWEKMP